MKSLVHPDEKVLFVVSITVSILVYALLVISVIGILYIAIFAAVGLVMHGLFIGYLRGNGVRVSEKQFPEVYQAARRLASQMDLNPMPQIYVLQAGGLLNAFATKFLGRNFVIVYSDILELAYEKGESALDFVLAHELAHLKRKHLTWRLVLYPSAMIPFLSTAYSRACEYTCDRFGAYYAPEGAVPGILVLAAGKKLYQNVDPKEFTKQASDETGFWVWLSEVFSTHPHLPKRLKAIYGFESIAERNFVPAPSEGT